MSEWVRKSEGWREGRASGRTSEGVIEPIKSAEQWQVNELIHWMFEIVFKTYNRVTHPSDLTFQSVQIFMY